MLDRLVDDGRLSHEERIQRLIRAALPEADQRLRIEGEKAGATAAARGLAGRMTYVRGEAERLPFGDGAFDLVTCQTVLIHVPDPRAVIREMIRVLRPGGRLLVAEPNNMAGTQLVGSLRFGEPVEQRLAMTRFQLVCERR